MKFIGIDPGLSGAVVILPDGIIHDAPVAKTKTSRKMYLLADMVAILRPYVGEAVACLENPHAVPGPRAMAMATLLKNVGQWEGILATLGIPYDLIDPKKWKTAMGVTGDKEVAVARAQQLFPHLQGQLTKARDGRSEALLICEYRRRLEGAS